MSQVHGITEESDDPDRRLWQLARLKTEYFHDAIKGGEAERRTSTANDPVYAPGSRDNYGRVRTIREILIKELGWSRANPLNMPLVVSPDRKLAIAVVLGDARTGVPGRPHPRTLRPVGDMKQLLVARNRQVVQEGLFEVPADPGDTVLQAADLADIKAWFLLTRRVHIRGKVVAFSELSHAVDTDQQGHINEWGERICMPPLEFEGVIDYIAGDDDGPEFEVNIEEH